MKIVYQDNALLVVDKPPGLLSVPGRGPDKQDCVVNRAKQVYPGMIDQPAVHRLDMDTSGLMLLAKTTRAHKLLSIQFQDKAVDKTYIAIVEGKLNDPGGEIQLAFRLDPDNRPYQVFDPIHGKLGITRWRRLSLTGNRTRIEFVPLTGRTHQLRLHAAHPAGLDAPIVGDRLYGMRDDTDDRMLLHAGRLSFRHPENQDKIDIESVPPF